MLKTESVQYDPPFYMTELASLLVEKRRQAGTVRQMQSIREAAREVGVSAATFSRIERGAVPDLETFRKMCLWLGMSADQLLSLSEQTEKI